MIRTVISDLGRVVLWFDNGIFLRKLAGRAGRPFDEVKATVHGDLELLRRFDGGAVTPAEFHARVMTIVGADMTYGEFFAIYNDIFTANAPAVEVLARVKAAGFKTLLLSNTDAERFGFVRSRFPEIGLFDGFVLSYELKLLKPDPEIYLAAARLADCAPHECVFIDDMEENVRGAIEAGLAGIHYRPDTDLASELKKLGLEF
jgi:HAD superfamily hydrolase (TIGR01509 family)